MEEVDDSVSLSDALSELEPENTVFMQITQIYNEVVTDLLSESVQSLSIKMDQDKNFYVEGLSSHRVESADEAQRMLSHALKNRVQH